ncbi:MAG: type II toxin-antitoxin system HicA family toxin [Clostridiales bacterium]|nr:type II toxin-antitoxin system HicA family toxin [Clostridiales bacterium]
MKVSELKRILRAGGCYHVKDGKEHEMWISPITGNKLRIPRHDSKELPTGTKDRILKDAGLK